MGHRLNTSATPIRAFWDQRSCKSFYTKIKDLNFEGIEKKNLRQCKTKVAMTREMLWIGLKHPLKNGCLLHDAIMMTIYASVGGFAMNTARYNPSLNKAVRYAFRAWSKALRKKMMHFPVARA